MSTFEKIIDLKRKEKTVQEICNILNISKGTVGYHLNKAYKQGINLPKQNGKHFLKHSEEIKKLIKEKKQDTCDKKILNEKFENLSFERIRKRVILEQNGKCIKCGIYNWLDKPIILELDHIDGNNKNNKRENLEAICPNCHSQTSTWRGRNIKIKTNKISDELFLDALLQNNLNIRQTLLKLNMAAKGGNYKRANRILKIVQDFEKM
jgi:5-methylcytosine-specific restriction endonuclease McrA